MSELQHPPQDHDGELAPVFQLRPEMSPRVVGNHLPITSSQYSDDEQTLIELFDQKSHADAVLRTEPNSRAQRIIDITFAALDIGPDIAELQKANETLGQLEEARSRAKNDSDYDRLTKRIDMLTRHVTPQNQRRAELAAAQAEAQHFLEQQYDEAFKKHTPIEFNELLGDILQHVDKKHGDTDIMRALQILRAGPLQAYPSDMITAHRTIMTMLFLRDFPQDDDPSVLDLGY